MLLCENEILFLILEMLRCVWRAGRWVRIFDRRGRTSWHTILCPRIEYYIIVQTFSDKCNEQSPCTRVRVFPRKGLSNRHRIGDPARESHAQPNAAGSDAVRVAEACGGRLQEGGGARGSPIKAA